MRYTALIFVFILSFISGNNATAQTLPTIKSAEMDRSGYNFMFDSEWKIDSSDADYDLDSYYSLDSKSGNGFITFAFFNAATNPEENVAEQIKAHLQTSMKNGQVTRFETWGKFKGKGAIISGKILGIYKGEIKVFSYTEKERSFLIVSQIMESGLLLIEKSFLLKN
jgi:hypothetical protein